MANRSSAVSRSELKEQLEDESPVADSPSQFPEQSQNPPGSEAAMEPKPIDDDEKYRGSGKLTGKVAVLTGADSGIGRAVAIAYAKEGADVAIIYLNEHSDAAEAKSKVEAKGQKCLLIAGDIGDEDFCQKAIDDVVATFGKIDILVNNAAEQTVVTGIENTTSEQLERTFKTNIFGFFYMTKAVLPHLKEGSAIINTTSIQAYKPSPNLIAYAATKGAIVNFTKALAEELTPRGIRVNGVAPGPVWTPLITSTFSEEKSSKFGADSPLKRPAQPAELAPAYVFLASNTDSSYIAGEIIMVTGGKMAGL